MNGRERLRSIFENKCIDRPALKLWGFHPGQKLLHSAYEPVYRLAEQVSDYMVYASSAFDIHLGAKAIDIVEQRRSAGPSPEWEDITTIWHTPEGDLKSVWRRSTEGNPGYELEHFVKTDVDIERLLSVPYEPFPLDMDKFVKTDRQVGERGICVFSLDHAMYALQRVMGPELFAILSRDCKEIYIKVIEEYSRRIRFEVERVFDEGFQPVFGWVGPEVCLPPLMSPSDFDDYVMRFDKPLCEYIHKRGGHVWVHCHNKVNNYISRFIDMGVDVLNPVEPPPMGDACLESLVAVYGNSIGFEGNIETHDLWSGSKEHIEKLVEIAVEQGSKSGRFILCPSAGYMEFTNPTGKYIDNLLTFLETGFKQVESCRQII